MPRSALWVAALALVLIGGGLYWWREQGMRLGPDRGAEAAVANAWTLGRKVALHGKQKVLLGEEENRSREVEAEVLQSSRGEMRIKYLTPPLSGVTVWDSADRTYRFSPKTKSLSVTSRQSSPDEDAGQEERLLQNYQARMSGYEQVAGRKAMVVELRPKGENSRWKRLWIDPETWVTLASEDRRGDDQILRRTRFTEISYLTGDRAPAAAEFVPPTEMIERYAQAKHGDTSSRFTPERLSQLVEFTIRLPKWLPQGYSLQGAYQTPCSCKERHQAARLEFSDGLNTITLFECAHPRCVSVDNCFTAEGANSPLSFHLETAKARYLAVGDAPKATLEKLVRSIPE